MFRREPFHGLFFMKSFSDFHIVRPIDRVRGAALRPQRINALRALKSGREILDGGSGKSARSPRA
ncbi:hypothetical protein MPC1_4010002 [Methylocella tundrae]|nr:hypothetical protein MPC1_4010002 [Methylocella tundrae]